MRPIRVLPAVSAAALVAAACGDDSTTTAAPAGSSAAPAASSAAAGSGDTASLSGKEILEKAKTAFKAAKSVHVIGDGTSGQGKETFKVDMRYGAQGTATGTITNGGETVELRRIDQVLYLKASPAFWTSTGGAKAAAVFGGKYVKMPVTDQRAAGIVPLTDKGAFIDAALSTAGEVGKGSTRTINGTKAIPLTTKDANGGGTLYVAATGQPLPLEVLPVSGSKDTGKVDFVDYDAPVDAATPPAAQTVDVSAVPGN